MPEQHKAFGVPVRRARPAGRHVIRTRASRAPWYARRVNAASGDWLKVEHEWRGDRKGTKVTRYGPVMRAALNTAARGRWHWRLWRRGLAALGLALVLVALLLGLPLWLLATVRW
jgi:hypothetical protein